VSAAATKTRPARVADEWVTVAEFIAEFKISRRTFDRWRALGKGPEFRPLGGDGPLRARRSAVDAWADLGEDGRS
jgi:hypothetical protein